MIEVRDALDTDLRFIHSSWFQSYWSATAAKYVPLEVYQKQHDALIDNLIASSKKARVAYLPEVPDEILGYCVFSPRAIHWLYVKNSYRKRGIGALLLPKGVPYYSQLPGPSGRAWLKKRNLQFNPYIQR